MTTRGILGKERAARSIAALLLAVGIVAGAGACSSGDETFTVTKKGDAKEINLGLVPKGSFTVEIKGFDSRVYEYRPGLKPTYLMLYDGVYGYNGPNRESPGILYLATQYLFSNVRGKIKGWNHGRRFAEDAYGMAWESDRWYTVEIKWDSNTIGIYFDGRLVSSATSGPIDSKVIAVMGYPSYFTAEDDTSQIGLQYRNWKYTTN